MSMLCEKQADCLQQLNKHSGDRMAATCLLSYHARGTTPALAWVSACLSAPHDGGDMLHPSSCREEAHRLQQQLDQHRLAAAETSQHAAGAQHALQEALEEQQSETRAAQTQASHLEAVRLAACPSWHPPVCWLVLAAA